MQIYLPIAEISLDVFLLLAMGGGVGFLSGLFGVGGGFLMTPLLIFTEVGNPGNVLQLDLGLIAPPIQLSNGNNPTSWVQDVKLGTLAPEGPPSCFNPGIKEDNPQKGFCGDGVVDPGEECDLGGCPPGQVCQPDCTCQ